MNTRIRKLRKTLDLTQAEIAQRIGTSANVFSNYEKGRRKPSNSVINNLCKTFHVNEVWLRTGEGAMFVSQGLEEEITEFCANIITGNSDFRRRFIAALAKLNPEQWAMLEQFINTLANEEHYPKTIDEKVAEYRRQLEDEEKAAAKSWVSGSRNSGGGSNTNLA